MTILTSIRNMLPSFGRNDVMEKLRNITNKLVKIVRPSFEAVIESLDELHYKSQFAKNVAKDFVLALPTRFKSERRPLATFLPRAMTNAQQLLDQLEQYVGKNIPNVVHIEGVSYQKATVLRLIEVLDFFADYTIRHLSYMVASETNIEDYGRADGMAASPAELRWLESNRGNWIGVMSLLQGDPKQAMKEVAEIPEVILGDMDIANVPALAGAAADPLHLGMIPLVSNVFRWVGIRMAHWELDRYERALKEKRVLELRLESRRNRLAGNQDAAAEAVVANYENELTLLREKITDMERRMENKR